MPDISRLPFDFCMNGNTSFLFTNYRIAFPMTKRYSLLNLSRSKVNGDSVEDPDPLRLSSQLLFSTFPFPGEILKQTEVFVFYLVDESVDSLVVKESPSRFPFQSTADLFRRPPIP